MTQPLIIDFSDNLPECDKLSKLLAEHESLILKYTFIKADYIDKIVGCLTEHSVLNFYWDNSIHIRCSISTKKIFEKKDEIYQCAKAFRQDALRLMQLMADIFNIDLETLNGLYELKHKKSNKQRGQLNEDWNYYLHGAECCFENSKTGQVVEVIIITKPEFGCLDAYFFYNYMATTERYKKLAAWFENDYTKVGKAIDILAREGTLTRRDDLDITRNVVAT